MTLLLEMFSYPFILRAFIVGILVSLCASLLGVSLVLKRYSMIGDGLSHVSFGALAIALACGWAPLQFSIPLVIAAAFFLLRIAENSRINADDPSQLISRCTSANRSRSTCSATFESLPRGHAAIGSSRDARTRNCLP